MAKTRSEEFTARLSQIRILPVVVIDNASCAVRLGQALLAGGLPLAEVTFRTAAARDAIWEMTQVDGLIVGAGTVLRAEQVDTAVAAGASFIVSPGFSAEVVVAARHHGVPVITGAATATEVQSAVALGQDVVKLFPAETVGGLATVKALTGPFPGVQFVPTGGITADNALAYLAHPSVLAVGGSWMVAADLLRSNDFAEITRRTAAAVALADPRQRGVAR